MLNNPVRVVISGHGAASQIMDNNFSFTSSTGSKLHFCVNINVGVLDRAASKFEKDMIERADTRLVFAETANSFRNSKKVREHFLSARTKTTSSLGEKKYDIDIPRPPDKGSWIKTAIHINNKATYPIVQRVKNFTLPNRTVTVIHIWVKADSRAQIPLSEIISHYQGLYAGLGIDFIWAACRGLG